MLADWPPRIGKYSQPLERLPLTPALSPGERGNSPQVFHNTGAEI